MIDLKELQKRIAETLGVPEEKESFAFETFKRMLIENLETEKAVRIPEVGIFQLKREPVPREERQRSGGTKDFLVFTPAENVEELRSQKTYLQIPLRQETPVSEENIDDVFDLSVDKPVAPLEAGEEEETVAEKVKTLLVKAEQLENFDILTLLFNRGEEVKEVKDEEEIIKESFQPEEKEKIEQPEVEEKKEEEDVWDEELEKELLAGDEEAVKEVEETKEEVPEESSAEEEKEEVAEDAENIEEDPFGALEESINKAVEEEAIPEEEIEKIVEENESPERVLEEEAEEEKPVEKSEEETVPEETTKSKRKYYYLTAAVLLVLIYLIFFTGGEKTKEKVKLQADSVKTTKVQPKKIIAKMDSAQPVEKKKVEQTNSAQTSSVAPKKKPQQTQSGTSKLYRKIKKERTVAKNIYYDGKEYMVQVSSWRKSMLAEMETKRLRKKGWDAFIVEAYVRKFRRKYYRVRIGGFKTLQEAKIFREKYIK